MSGIWDNALATLEDQIKPHEYELWCRPIVCTGVTDEEITLQAPNAYLRKAAKISQTLNLEDYDEAGPELSRVLWLVHVGEQVERQRQVATLAATMMVLLLVGGGIIVQWSRRNAPRSLARDSAGV